MQVFQTKIQITKYIAKKEKELNPLGFYCYKRLYDYYGCTVVWTKGWRSDEEYISILLYSNFIGQGIVRSAQDYRKKRILTTKECGIEDYLIKEKIPYMLAENQNVQTTS